MEIAAAVVGSIIGCACKASVFEQCKHMINPTEQIEKLRKRKAELIALEADVDRRLHIAAVEQGKVATNVVKNWLSAVKHVLDRTNVIEEEVKIPMRILNGLLPNCCSRSKLGQVISQLILEVTSLSKKGRKLLDESIALLVPEMGMQMPKPKLMGKTTAQKNFEMVWECLLDDENGMIGVYGMGGVGKTTIIKGINNRLLKEQHRFDKVIWVTVSKDANIYKLQNDIAKVVALDLSHEQDDALRPALLLKELHKRGRIIIILDDMWEAFSLHEIGIPDFTKDTGCKIVLTTRSLDVCRMMGCQKVIKVELLSKDEAWKLFIKTVGMKLAPEVEKIAKDVAEECSRLPLAIITIGGAMKGKNGIREWRVALSDLQESINLIVSMEEQVIERLKFSFNRLEDDILKNCFLYCALYPEDLSINTEELIIHWVMEGLIKGGKIEDELDRGHVILNKLRSLCMLEYYSKYDHDSEHLGKYVKMHDLIRDMALHIIKVDSRIMVKAGVLWKDMPDEEAWREDLERASFIGSGISGISISPNCRGINTMLLNHSSSLKHITHGFFVQMQSLRILNISYTGIELLPTSISDLVSLHLLDLSGCGRLSSIPSLEKLRLLSVLRLTDTAIEELPHGMEALVDLKRLHLTNTRENFLLS